MVVLNRHLQLQTEALLQDVVTDTNAIRVELDYALEHAAYRLRMALLPLAEPTEERVLASYPATLWDHVKKVLGFKYRKYEVRQAETVVYPALPQTSRDFTARVYKANAITLSD